MNPDAERLLTTPDYHFLAFDGDSALFLQMDRAAYHRSAFLDRRAQALSDTPLRLPLAPLISMIADRSPPRTGWIFHVAHCGSTLLSRLIDSPESSLVLREPPPLRQLGLAAAAGDTSRQWRERLGLAHNMAARRFDRERPTIIKANVPVNFMLDELDGNDPESPFVLLHLALEPYLLAVLRTPQHRTWIERITSQLAPTLAGRVGLSTSASLAERAAALWLAQLRAFQLLLASNPLAVSLDAEQLFASPVETALAAADHFGATDVDVAANADALAGHYAKDISKPFDAAASKLRQKEDRIRLSEEIAVSRSWIERSDAAKHLPIRLDRPLLGDAPILLG